MIVDPCALLSTLVKEPDEAEWLEFKQSYWDPQQIGKNCSALANSAMLLDKDRAYVVYGIENGSHHRVGTTLRLKKKKVGGENFENWLNRMLRPSLNIELCDFECDGLKFSIIELEPSYHAPVKFDGVEYIRIGENTRRLDEFVDRQRALWFKTGSRTFEDAIALPGLDEEAVHALLDVDAYFALRRMAKPTSRRVQLGALMGSGLLRDTRQNTYDITNLGALLLARNLFKFPALAGKIPRVIRYLGANKMRSQPEKPLTKGYANGFQELLEHLQGLLAEERTVRGQLTTVVPYPEDMLREMVANALVHQDLTISGAGPMIEVFSNRVEISNPGRSLIEKDRIIQDKQSRNTKLASAMRDFHLCEERGSGLDKAFQAAEDTGLPAPDMIVSQA
jgi:ATP-dependent DNA helicase RecG